MPVQIDRRAGLQRAQFQADYASKSRPVILTDAIEHWPARGKWTLDYFAERYGDKRLHYDFKEHRVGDVIAQLQSPDPCGTRRPPYINQVTLDAQFPELWNDVGHIAVAQDNRIKSRWLPQQMRLDKGSVAVFVGAEGSGFHRLHWDYSYLHVFISQVFGPKDFILYRPEATPHLYPNPEYPNYSLIPDPFDVDLAALPDVAHADATRFRLEEGETLFLPGGWWHATRIPAPSIAIAESTLDGHNWRKRSQFYLHKFAREKVPVLKLAALNGYLIALDVAMRIVEVV